MFGTSGRSGPSSRRPGRCASARKPANVSFEDAAGSRSPATGPPTRPSRKANVEPGQKGLINGASGGVGTYAVQLAKVFGADVTAVCSTRNVDQYDSLGADRVVDYAKEDFTRLGIRHEAMLDIAGSRRFSQSARPDAQGDDRDGRAAR